LELARWCRERLGQVDGADPWVKSRMTSIFPPAPPEIGPTDSYQTRLDAIAGPGTPADPDDVEPDGGSLLDRTAADQTAGGGS